MAGRIIQDDGVMRTRQHHCAHENKTYCTLEQPTRKLILERNADLRKNKEQQRDLSFGRHLASIPLEDYHALQMKFPALRTNDAKARSEELMRILRMPEYKYLLV